MSRLLLPLLIFIHIIHSLFMSSMSYAEPLPPKRPNNLMFSSSTKPASEEKNGSSLRGRDAENISPSVNDSFYAGPPSIEKINFYLNSIKGLRAEFNQFTADGRQSSGMLYILRPGKLRFEYNPPSMIEVVSDGRSVAIIDKKLKTQDVYFINQTPLKFLLQQKIDVDKDSKVKDLRRDGQYIVLVIEDKSTFGGTSTIRITFNGVNYTIKEWVVTDAQGNDTNIILSNLDPSFIPPADIFIINEQKLIEPR